MYEMVVTLPLRVMATVQSYAFQSGIHVRDGWRRIQGEGHVVMDTYFDLLAVSLVRVAVNKDTILIDQSDLKRSKKNEFGDGGFGSDTPSSSSA